VGWLPLAINRSGIARSRGRARGGGSEFVLAHEAHRAMVAALAEVPRPSALLARFVILTRSLRVVFLIALGTGSRADQIERIERPDWLIFGGAHATVACLTAFDGPIVQRQARGALPLPAVGPAPGLIRHRPCLPYRPAALIESRH
jgi:hypothetical protein